MYFPITFTGNNSISLKNKLTKLLKEFYPQILIRVIFKPKTTIQRFFKFKDVVPLELQSNVIYKYTCDCCNAVYIGQTKRQLKVRIFEHIGRSIRTNRPLGKPPFSAIRDHAFQKDHPVQSSSFSILHSCSSDEHLQILESFYIHKVNLTLCNYERSSELLCF